MLALIELFFFLLFLPTFLFGIMLRYIADSIGKVFEPRLMLTAVWLGIFGAYLVPSATPDDSRLYVTMIERVAQSHLGPLSTPAALLCVALLLFVASAVVATKTREKSQ